MYCNCQTPAISKLKVKNTSQTPDQMEASLLLPMQVEKNYNEKGPVSGVLYYFLVILIQILFLQHNE